MKFCKNALRSFLGWAIAPLDPFGPSEGSDQNLILAGAHASLSPFAIQFAALQLLQLQLPPPLSDRFVPLAAA